MIVDVGGGTTEVAVISLKGVVEQVIGETATRAILLVRAREYAYREPVVIDTEPQR